MPDTQMRLSAYRVERSDAHEAEPESQTAASSDASGHRIGQGAIPHSSGKKLAPDTIALKPLQDHGAKATETPFQPVAAQVQNIDAAIPASVIPEPIVIVAGQTSDFSNPVQIQSEYGDPVAPGRPETVSAELGTPQAIPLVAAAPVETAMTAALAFAGAGDAAIDPVSVAAFQSFVDPDGAGRASVELRDGIAGVLSRLPCSRMQVQFHPENNTLEIVGHVPEHGLQAPIVAALQAQMGESIAITDNLLILPRPQCGALAGIGEVGLPQSTDQITNPLLVGEDAHAREFRYSEGQQLVLELTAPDYDAYVYVDYFDADGRVIHLSPNESVDLVKSPAKSTLRVGAEDPGDPGLYITIGPPFGQEIAVAFATSEPLYDDIRPLSEPADGYLNWLRERVRALRADNPDFKGEWVYFFVTTSP